mmetsp:Transcript_30969/g.82274  ORF Transcript_30969/g.82274 Transcript_30969/m.82274 type:complete len:237 (+) Transcript_30969:2169-2879(+)
MSTKRSSPKGSSSSFSIFLVNAAKLSFDMLLPPISIFRTVPLSPDSDPPPPYEVVKVRVSSCIVSGETEKYPWSARYARETSSGKNMKVNTPSQISTMCGLATKRMKTSQTYAKMEKEAVTTNTGTSLILLTSPSGMAPMHTAIITNRLKAALPTMVDGPKSPLKKLLLSNSITLSKISGALEPSAMRVRLETVAFQTSLVSVFLVSGFWRCSLFDVIFSMELIKTSAIMATPKKQ